MSLAKIYSRAQLGINAPLVSVEVHISPGLPGISIVGMPETCVRESKDRVRSALIFNHFTIPARRITVNLAPAELRKQGGRFDLAISIGILIASRQLSGNKIENLEFLGELALDGTLRSITSILPSAVKIAQSKRNLICPADNADEAKLISELNVIPAQHLLEVCNHLNGIQTLSFYPAPKPIQISKPIPDLSEVKGQDHAKRALEISAAGNHSLLFVGPPGTGKTMLANRLNGLLPDLEETEACESATVFSISHLGFSASDWGRRPFRAPHHTASAIALIGGGSNPQPGEVSLAHNGILFLDELPEFSRNALEVLRQPMEAGSVTISRAARQVDFPARFLLVAAMNPCPCGFLGDSQRQCTCTQEQIQKYRSKISGPLLDRIDLQVFVNRIPVSELSQAQSSNAANSKQIQKKIVACRQLQMLRNKSLNSNLSNQEIESVCRLKKVDAHFLAETINQFGASTRSYYKVLKIARTISDLDGIDSINKNHILEALHLRRLDNT